MPISYDASTNTITVTGFTEESPCSFEDIYQTDVSNGWGVVEKKGTAYFIHAIIQLGNSDNDAWLVDKGKQLFFYADADYAFKNSAKTGHLILGEIENEEEKTTKNGCYVECHQDNFSTNVKELNLLDTMMVSKSDSGISTIMATGCIGKIWNSKFQNFRFAGVAEHLDMYNIEFKQGYCPFESFGVGSGNMEKITVMDVNYAVVFFRLYSFIIKELTAKSINNALVQFFLAMGNSYAIDWDVDWSVNVLTGFIMEGSAKLWRQYSFNVRVQDERNNPISNAQVILKDNNGNIVYSETTDELGRTPTQVLNWGYYTLSNNNCVEYPSTPHTLVVTKQGYQKYEAKIELTKKLIDFPVVLKKEDINIDQEILL